MFHVVLEENVRNKSKLHLRFTISQVRLAKQKEEVISELRGKNLAMFFFDKPVRSTYQPVLLLDFK